MFQAHVAFQGSRIKYSSRDRFAHCQIFENFLKNWSISIFLVAWETGKTSSRCLRARCAVGIKFLWLVGLVEWQCRL